MLFTPNPVPVMPGGGYGWSGPRPDDVDGREPGDAAAADTAPADTAPADTAPADTRPAPADAAASAGARDGDAPAG